MVTPLIFMLHDGRTLPQPCRDELTEVDYDEVRQLRDIWHREDFGEHASRMRFTRRLGRWPSSRMCA